MSQSVDPAIRERVGRLNERYMLALDTQDMEGWLACFDSDGQYFVQGADNAAAGLPLSLMYDDCYERLEDRVTFVNDIWPGAFEEYQTRHFLQPLVLEPVVLEPATPASEKAAIDEPERSILLRAVSNVTVMASDQRGRTNLFITGQYVDTLRHRDCIALIKERRVVMDTFATPGVVVYPL